MSDRIIDDLTQYREARHCLIELKKEKFPEYSVVVRKEGHVCIVKRDGELPDQLALLHENGNIWWVPMESVSHHQGLPHPWITEYLKRNEPQLRCSSVDGSKGGV